MSRVRIPIAAPLETREIAGSGSFFTDSWLINCYVETQPDGRKLVVKRPGMSTAFTYNGGGATSGQGTAYYQGSIYAMGSNVLYRLSGSGNGGADGTAWTSSTSAPWYARRQHQTVAFNGQILILGGFSTAAGFIPLNDVWASSDSVNWQQLTAAAPWPARCRFAAVVLGNTLYVIGGINGTTVYNDVWSTTDGVNWTQVVSSASWSARWGHGAVAFNQGIVLMGGHDSSTNYLNDVWYSADGATWTRLVLNASWSARHGFGCAVFSNKIWVIGGNAGGTVVTTVYSSPDGITWTNTGNLPLERQGPLVAVYRGLIWIIGGYNNALTGTTTVYTTPDGVSFSTPTANYGGGTIAEGGAVVWQTPASVSSINATTIWLIGGFVSGADSNQIYRATLNVSLPSSFSPATSNGSSTPWQSTTQNAGQYLIWKNPSDAWVLYSGQLQKITSPNYPTSTVAGIVNLDDTIYVMDAHGVIYGSNLSDPFTWSSLNFITADYESDTGIAIAKYGQLLVAFKSTSMQFFYDAGRYPGSPLLPNVSANIRVGCVSAATVVAFNNNLFWVARTKQSGRYVAMLNGTTPVRISDPQVERILDGWVPATGDTSTAIRVNGHDWYILTLSSSNISLSYDTVENRWFILKNDTKFKFDATNYVSDDQHNYLQDPSLGLIYQVSPFLYQDSGSSITSTSTGLLVDNGTNLRKFCGGLTVIGDRLALSSPNNATIAWSDDDGQTYSSGYTVDLTKARPKVPRVGSFRRRRFKITHASNNPFRVEALELEVA